MVEDSEVDMELILRLLRKGGYDPVHARVETAQQMKAALQSQVWDIVLADYRMPQFSAPQALEVLQETGLDLPFLVVSGGIGEATAVATMKAGAHDYLMKDNLARLVPAVERELREAANRSDKRRATQALRESELRYRLLWETATDAILLMDTAGIIHFANPAVAQVFGYQPEELIGREAAILQPDHTRDPQNQDIENCLISNGIRLARRIKEMAALRKDGREIQVEVAFSDMEFAGSRWFVGFVRDITERKRTEQALLESQEQFRVARDIQQHLFPKSAPNVPGFEIAGASRPAEAMGGDYFDYLPMMHNRIGLVVGDVTGHGVGPAFLMSETRAYLRILAQSCDDPGHILTRANSVLAQDVGPERFVTMLLAQLDPSTRSLTYVNAGHPPGYIFTASGEIRASLKRTNLPLGIRSNTVYAGAPAITLAPGEMAVLVTDGFEEAVAPDDHVFGIEKVFQVVREHRQRPATEIVEALYQAVQGFIGSSPQIDDLTVIVAKAAEEP
jgi:PAS domain S-box-containing protein